ncbi:hypothetical protein [Paracoccus sp. JM45]|uniref:hypothetical protein n=1 Tax=Paracoccus sp. JM45 TaxID=2283626 RepID=UPI0011C345EF|nr:hypothetical protein [Paracoccus sp. JM45]
MTRRTFASRQMACLVLVAGLVLATLGMTNNGPFIKGAKDYSQNIAQSSAVTYLSLRLINAAISFAEEVEVGGSVIAVNGSAHPFKMLEPVDDAVERLSSAIFLVGTVSGIMTVVLPVLGGAAFVMIGTAMTVLALLDLVGGRFPGQSIVSGLSQNLARLGGLAFMVVIAFSISSWFAEGISDRAWGQYQQTLADIANQMPDLAQDDRLLPDGPELHPTENPIPPKAMDTPPEETGLLEKAMDGLKSAGEGAVNAASSAASGVGHLASGAINGVRQAASSANASYVKAKDIVIVLSTQSDELVQALMGVFAAFLFKTVVCPVLILIGLWKLAGSFEFMRKDAPHRTSAS